MEQYQELLLLAKNAMADGNESRAKDIFEHILQKLAFRYEQEPVCRPYADQALAGMAALTSSSNEYIWESSSQLYSDYREIIAERTRSFRK